VTLQKLRPEKPVAHPPEISFLSYSYVIDALGTSSTDDLGPDLRDFHREIITHFGNQKIGAIKKAVLMRHRGRGA
jgi:hypothetical protein